MENVKKLEAELEAAKAKQQAIAKALKAAHEAYEAIKEQHEQALKDVNNCMAEVIKAMQG